MYGLRIFFALNFSNYAVISMLEKKNCGTNDIFRTIYYALLPRYHAAVLFILYSSSYDSYPFPKIF